MGVNDILPFAPAKGPDEFTLGQASARPEGCVGDAFLYSTPLAAWRYGKNPQPMELAQRGPSWVYMLMSQQQNIYVGASDNLLRRLSEHERKNKFGFTAAHACARLVYFESHIDSASARQREANLKHWRRAWKLSLIEAFNQRKEDLTNKVQ